MQIAKMLMNTYSQHDRLMRINELINQQPVANMQKTLPNRQNAEMSLNPGSKPGSMASEKS